MFFVYLFNGLLWCLKVEEVTKSIHILFALVVTWSSTNYFLSRAPLIIYIPFHLCSLLLWEIFYFLFVFTHKQSVDKTFFNQQQKIIYKYALQSSKLNARMYVCILHCVDSVWTWASAPRFTIWPCGLILRRRRLPRTTFMI